MFEDITRYFVSPEGAPSFDIDVKTEDEAREYIKKNFRGIGEVKLIIKHYRLTSSTPYIINT